MRRSLAIACIGMSLLHWPALVEGSPSDDVAEASSAAKIKPLRVRPTLLKAVDYYLMGDYEAAQPLFEQAQAGRSQLTEMEKSRLDVYVKRNTEALQARREALEQLKQAEEALNQGRPQEAEEKLKGLRTNSYLTRDDQAQVARLSNDLKPRTSYKPWALFNRDSARAEKPAATPKADADALLAEARKALDRKDYDGAEKLARQAEEAGYRTLLPWRPTPAKILRDVQLARARQPSLPTVENAPVAANTPVTANAPAAANDLADSKRDEARTLLKQAREAITANDLDKAKNLVKQADGLRANIPWWEENTPDKLKGEIAKAERASSTAVVSTSASPVKLVSVPTNEKAASSADVKMMVKDARKALDAGNLAQAEELAQKARVSSGVKYNLFEDTPEKLLSEIAKAQAAQNYQRAVELLTEARQKMDQQQFEEAERLTWQAEALHPNFGMFYRGDRPEKLRNEIVNKRRAVRKPQLPPLQQ